jgi:glycosyltransferase involved in cell wall biosynthesis
MNFVSITYTKKQQFSQPDDWLQRIHFYLGVLEALGRKHSVISIDRISYKGEIFLNSVLHYFPDVGNNRLGVPWKLNRLAAKQKPDIVLVQGMGFPLQVILLRMQLGKRVRIIVQHHAEKPFTGIKKIIHRLADRCIDAYFFSSGALGESWVSKGNLRSPQKIHEVMEVSSDFTTVQRSKAQAVTGLKGHPGFLWVGRLDNNKNPLMIIKAFLRFATAWPAARLYMLYHTTELLPDIERLLDTFPNGREVITLVGKLPHAELQNWYNSADFMISGSWYESGGTAVCEAMSCGCIPILTDIFSFRAMTANGQCGQLYEPGNEDALLAALLQAALSDVTEERRKVLRQFRAELSFEAIANKIQIIAASLKV